MYRKDILLHKQDIVQWISENYSKAYICKQLHCKPDTLNKYLQQMNIVYNGNQGNKGHKSGQYKSAYEYLGTNKYINSHTLKLKLLKEHIMEHKCDECGLTEWNGRPIPLELHHIDGNHYNNVLSNLRLLCPNCHALMPNNSGSANAELAELV